MLKVKEGFELKELEKKYGFGKGLLCGETAYLKDDVLVWSKSRQIVLTRNVEYDILYDLITAGIVVKE